MKLWTIQPIEWYNKLLEHGIMYGNKDYIDPDFLSPYSWLMQQMDKRIGKRPFPDCYPIWAWYQYHDSHRRKPDLRSAGFLAKGTQGVRIEINKNKQDILLSDFDLWHYPLNYWILSSSEEESEAFDQLLTQNKIQFADQQNYTAEIKQQIEQSWEKIFNMNYAPEYIASPFEKKSIQATFWSISTSQITKVEKFTAR